MSKSNPLKVLVGIVLASSVVVHGSSRGASDDDHEDSYDEYDADFSYGDSCEKLEDLPWRTLEILLSNDDLIGNDYFCAVEVPEDCADFGQIIEGFGQLRESEAPGYCQFLPLPKTMRLPTQSGTGQSRPA